MAANPTLSLCCQHGARLESIMVCFASLPLEPGSTIQLTWAEIRNRLGAFIEQETGEGADETIVGSLIKMLDQNNSIAKAYRMARDWCHSHTSVNVELRLISERTNLRQYNAPIVAEVPALITKDFGDGAPTRDIIGTTLLRGGRLFQKYLVDAYTAIEEQRLSWTRNNQDTLCVDMYHNVCDAVIRGDTNAAGLGKRNVLPHTFTSAPRYMMQNYQDAMDLCRAYGNPDMFITFTSNPKWPKINEILAYMPGQRAMIGRKWGPETGKFIDMEVVYGGYMADAVSTISEEYLLEFTSEYGIPEDLHPELPGPEDTIVDFPEGKVGAYTKFFKFANYRIPFSQFLFDILGYYQIHLSQLSVIGAAKVGHFQITCRVLNIIPILNLFCVFYIPSYKSGWMSFSKRPGKNTPQCYTKPLDSLKNWNNHFFWVDEKVFPTVVAWRTGAPKDGMPPADSYSVLDVTTLNTRRAPFEKQPELLLCLVGLSRRYFLGDDVAPNPAKVTGPDPKSPLDFANEDLPPPNTKGVGIEEQIQDKVSHRVPPLENSPTTEVVLEPELAVIGPLVHKRRRKRGNDEADANASPKVLRKDHVAFRPAQSTIGGKSLATMGKATSFPITPTPQDTPSGASSVKDPDPLSYAEPRPIPEQDIAQSSKKTVVAKDPDSERSTSFTSMGGSPRSVYQPGWGVTNNCHLDTPSSSPTGSEDRSQGEADKNIEALLEAEADMKKAAEAKNAELIKSAFEEFKKYEDDRVEQRCVETDARLDKLSVDFDEELYPHMLTVIAGRRWVIGHDLRLAHGKADRDLEAVKAYDPKAHNKYLKALQELKDLKCPLVDQLEGLKDAPMELIMASLHLESNSGEDAPQDPWAIKEEILLEDAIAANVSRAEKKKKCRVVCRTHGVGSAHHARSDGVPVSAPTVAPQGLAILLADASTQTEISEGEASPRLLRSMSLPAMYNLDWP
ncbi:gypsy type transposase [Tanacetum coccineum]